MAAGAGQPGRQAARPPRRGVTAGGHLASYKSSAGATRSQRRRPAFRGAYNSFDGKNSFQSRCYKILERLKKHKCVEPFLFPVDYKSLGLPDYPKIISHPMDISTVEKKLREHEYSAFGEFEADVQLIWSNAMKYNPPHSQIYSMTADIKRYFEKINSDEQEMEKHYKMKSRMLSMEKKGNGLQAKGGAKHGKALGYKGAGAEKPLTYQEKKNLSTMIRSLETEHLLGVWEIVSEGNDQIKDNEIEFDIETLPVRKARELEKYVQGKLELMRKSKKKPKPEHAEPLPPPRDTARLPPQNPPAPESGPGRNAQVPVAPTAQPKTGGLERPGTESNGKRRRRRRTRARST